MIYKPGLSKKVLSSLQRELGEVAEYLTCCRHDPALAKGTQIINTCAGCDKRYRQLYEEITTKSLWEVLAESTIFPFPNYQGLEMTILDACPTRNQVRVHDAVRTLLTKMNITVVEPAKTKTKGTCCGDSYYGSLTVEQVKQKMIKRATEM
ncbi:MAG: (Fe-S)-binding protein, partial [Firmicutes bacterium]|nr:(Fe-S)-binding protein [Bacillota bacterium]